MLGLDDSEYKFHYNKGKRLFKDGKIEKALDELKIAFKINPNEILQIKINKVEALVNNSQTKEVNFKADDNKMLIDGKYYVNKRNFNKLYDYQQEGVTWLFKLFELKKGCILADDMGLGKTIQTIFYLRELFESDLIRSVLIIMPKSLLINWERELKQWAPSVLVLMYFGNDKERNLNKIQRKGGILVTTYGTVMHSWDELNCKPDFKWSVLVLDEGHKIKNPSSKTFKTVNALRADLRIVLTGTAVQNNLKELWALFDFTHQGSLLGTYPTFSREYEKPITDSRKKDASLQEKHYGDKVAVSLKKLMKPFFLRRTKEEVINQINTGTGGGLSKKNDIAVWIPMTEVQIDCYQKFLERDDVKVLLLRTEKRSPLLELNILKKICDHPRLLSPEQCSTMDLKPVPTIHDITIEDLIAESGKLAFVIKLVKKIVEEDSKCLIFSQSKVILTILERILLSYQIKYLRLDGDVLKASERQETVDNFNINPKYKILLLTLQVGGIGLTLTGADRVIIYDLSWNPSVDAQAVDRIYRIGQKKDVIIYRLITCGTVEEKIYRRQVFKDSLNRQTTGIKKHDDNTYRYFTQSELIELFTLSDPYSSDTQMQLNSKHSNHRKTNEYLSTHIEWLKEQNIFGISDHDLLFTEADEKIDIDEETEERLSANLRQAECNIIKEAQLKSTTSEQDLRRMMSQMTIQEPKGKIKEKYLNENMFIPSKKDLKRPVYNEIKGNNFFQTKINDYVSVGKIDSKEKISIDLTENDENQDSQSEHGIQNVNSVDLIEESLCYTENSDNEIQPHPSEIELYDYQKIETPEKNDRNSLNHDENSGNISEEIEQNSNSNSVNNDENSEELIDESSENVSEEIEQSSNSESEENISDNNYNSKSSDSEIEIKSKNKYKRMIVSDSDEEEEEEFQNCNSNPAQLAANSAISNINTDDKENDETSSTSTKESKLSILELSDISNSNKEKSQISEKSLNINDASKVQKATDLNLSLDESLEFEKISLQDTFNESEDLLDETVSSMNSD